jgi:hypothetical protein
MIIAGMIIFADLIAKRRVLYGQTAGVGSGSENSV